MQKMTDEIIIMKVKIRFFCHPIADSSLVCKDLFGVGCYSRRKKARKAVSTHSVDGNVREYVLKDTGYGH